MVVEKDYPPRINDENTEIYQRLQEENFIHHPMIIGYLGYGSIDSQGKSHPVIETNYMPNGSLKDIRDLVGQCIEIYMLY